MSDLSAFINQQAEQARQAQQQAREAREARETQQAKNSAKAGNNAGQGGEGEGKTQSVKFLNYILAGAQAGQAEGKSGKPEISQALINDLKPGTNANTDSDDANNLKALLAQLKAGSGENGNNGLKGLLKQLVNAGQNGNQESGNSIAELLNSIAPGNGADKQTNLGKRLSEIAEQIKQALNLDKSGDDQDINLEQIQDLLKQQEALAGEGIPGLIGANLSPQELTQLSDTLKGRDTGGLQGIMLSLVSLTGGAGQGQNQGNSGPQSLQAIIANALNQQSGQNEAQNGGQSGDSGKSLSAKVNALLGNAGNGQQQQGQGFSLDLADLPPGPRQLAQSRIDFLQYGQAGQNTGQNAGQNTGANANANNAAQMLMNMGAGANGKGGANGNATQGQSGGKGGATAQNGMMLTQGQLGRGLSPLAGLLQGNDAGLNTQFDQFSDWMMQFGGQPAGAGNSGGNNGTMALFATAQSTGAQHASQQHSSTQMVAATLQKNAARGGQGTRNLTMQLEPPDLGRMKIRMDMSSDNQLRTHLTVEKPETLMMLQRDGHTLERALQQAGVDTSREEALSFELAQDDSAFGQDNDGRGGNNGDGRSGNNGANGEGDADEGEVIATDMTWTIDPETGIQHYDIIA